MAETLDLRGRELTVPASPVLSDPSGRRARLLARGGRALAVVALLWVAGLVLAGLGVLPASDVPLGRAVAGPQAPSGWRHLPARSSPTAQDLRPAIPAAAASGYGHAPQHLGAGTTGLLSTSSLTTASRPRSTAGSSGAHPTTVVSTPAGGVVGTGLANATSHGHSGGATAPGLTKTTAPGNSGSGHTVAEQGTTSTGKSGSAPGHTAWTPPNGHSTLH
jgi:hypothetical protein